MLFTEENLPKEILDGKQFIERFARKYQIFMKDIEGKRYVVCWRINCTGLTHEQAVKYCEGIKATSAHMLPDKYVATYFIPVWNKDTQLSILDLKTMKYAIL